MDDPFFVVKREVTQSMQALHALPPNTPIIDIQDRLANIIADLDELDDTIKLDKKDVDERKFFVATTRKEVNDVKARMLTQNNNHTHNSGQNTTQKPKTAESEQQQQQQILQQQDVQMDGVMHTIRNMKEIGQVMGNELQDQERLLNEVEIHVDETQGRMDDGLKRMKEFIVKNSDMKQQLTIIALVVILIVMLVLVFTL